MKISIIICTRDRANHLRHILQSLACVEILDNAACELLVIDNASTDFTKDVVESFRMPNMDIRWVYEPRHGLSFARNTGLAHAKGDILLFTDDDIYVPTNWVSEMCDPIAGKQAHAVAGAVKIAPGLERAWMEHAHRLWLAATEAPKPGSDPHMVGASMAFSREVLTKVRGFDTELGAGALGSMEDTLFSKQLSAGGFKIVYSDAASVEHHFQKERLTRASFLKLIRQHGESGAYVAYHWDHKAVTLPALRQAHKKIQVELWRRAHSREVSRPEGIDLQEMYNLHAFYFYRRFITERRKPRKYSRPPIAMPLRVMLHPMLELTNEEANAR